MSEIYWYLYQSKWIWPHLLTVISFLLAVALISRLMSENYPPGTTMAWILAIVFAPYVAIPLYLMFGTRKLRKQMRKKGHLYFWEKHSEKEQYDFLHETEGILIACEAPPTTGNNRVEMTVDGVEAYEKLVEMIREAEETIHIATFILGRDDVARQIIDELAQKAKEGVKVRFLVDAMGTFWTRRSLLRPLTKAGGQVGIFLPVLPLQQKWSANLRNHRKIVVVDGKRAKIGGMNIAQEYLGPNERPDRWLDFSMFVEGPAVADIEWIFASDWKYATEEKISLKKGAPHHPRERKMDRSLIQVVASGPDMPQEPLFQALHAALFQAQERIWIVTPYYVPDSSLNAALATQARMGRDVRVIVPQSSDITLPDVARYPYLREIRDSGGKIYSYTPKMLHAKLILIDDHIAVVGSANMDMRSFYWNYEIAAFLYSTEDIQTIESIIEDQILANSEAMKFPNHKGFLGWARKWREEVCRLFAPLL